MSSTIRAGLLFGLASVAAFIASFLIPIPFVNIILAYGSVLALGWAAGYTAAKTTGALQGQGTGRGATAGALAGATNLIVSALALTLLFSIISRIPGVQSTIQGAFSQAQAQNPNLNPNNLPSTSTILGASGAFLGFCLGLVNLLLMTIAGLVGGAMWKGPPYSAGMPSGQYMPAIGYTVGNQPPYGSQGSVTGLPSPPSDHAASPPEDSSARIYPGDRR